MKGDISADFHAPAKRYSGVRAQAGRVLTDADFNAAFDVIDDRLEALIRTMICAAGSPDQGLKVLSAAPVALEVDGTVATGHEVTLAPGSFVLGGRVTVLAEQISSLAQGDWLSQPLSPAWPPPAPQPGRRDLVWIEQVERGSFAVEDRELQERALGAADTTSRLRPQIRIRLFEDVPDGCSDAAEALAEGLRLGIHGISEDRTEILSAARLGLSFVGGGPSLDPCAPAAAAGYLGAENHTLRVMLTAPDRFVWAWDHGTPLYRVQIVAAGGEVLFLTEPRDPMLYPLPGQVIEILPWDVLLPNREKLAAPLGHLGMLSGHYDPRSRRIAWDDSLPAGWQDWLDALPDAVLGRDDDPPRFFYARVWQGPQSGSDPDQPIGSDIVLPETGVALHFAGQGIAGDYWTAALRPAAPELIQPWNLQIDPAAGDVPVAPPIGPRRFHAPLALIRWPAAPNAVPMIDDCRNRFRRLCRIKGCCTYQVGDGHGSFGDFNSIQEAVDALPPEGGEICLLPGRHEGRIDLRNRRDIRISGCGRRTRLVAPADPAHPGRPGIWLNGASGIAFSDFAVMGAGGPVFGATEATDIGFLRVAIRAGDSAGIAIARGARIRISACILRAEPLAGALTANDLATLMPLVFLAGETLVVEHSTIRATFAGLNRNRVALGGLQIGGDSRDVRIEDNRISGGNGHGITLGSVIPGERQEGDDIVIHIPPWITIDEDGCVKFIPGGTLTIPGRDQETPPRSAGPVTGLRIRDNLIADHGGTGISIAHWFIPQVAGPTGRLDDIELDEVTIDGNRIHRCMRIDLVSSLPIEAAFNSGYGGIALAAVADIAIDGNEIRDCGSTGRSPICGIYLRFAERLRITRNRISENGRPASLTNPLLVGNIGGIVIGHADGVETPSPAVLRQVPAAVITGNHVISPEGRALELTGTGTMMVRDNSLIAHGNNIGGVLLMLLIALLQRGRQVGERLSDDQIEGQFRAALSQIGGSAVLILNTGLNRNLALSTSLTPMVETRPAPAGTAPAPNNEPVLSNPTRGEWQAVDAFAARGVIDPADRRDRPGGAVSFSDNMVVFDAQSDAITLSLCSLAILSLDDVGMHDNHCALDLGGDFVMINALVLGLASCRVQGNRFRETLRAAREPGGELPPTLLSALTVGLLNATEMNQGDYCSLVLGMKRPQILTGNPAMTAVLDSNRHMMPDNRCAVFRRFDAGNRVPPGGMPARPLALLRDPALAAEQADLTQAAALRRQELALRQHVGAGRARLELARENDASAPDIAALETMVAARRERLERTRHQADAADIARPAPDPERAQIFGRVTGIEEGEDAERPTITASALSPEGRVIAAVVVMDGGAFLIATQGRLDRVTLQLSDAEGRLLARAAEPVTVEPGRILLTEMALGRPAPEPGPVPTRLLTPDLIGQSEGVAHALLSRLGLQAATEDHIEEGQPDIVLAQKPDAGTEIEAGATVTLTIRRPATGPVLPSLVGLDRAEAEHWLKQAGIGAEVVFKPDPGAEGRVLAHEPAAGTPLVGLQVVVLNVSAPRDDLATVPELLGLAGEEAARVLKAAGFEMKVGEVSDPAAPPGIVAQDPAAGSRAPIGSVVTVTLNSPPPVEPDPDRVMLPQLVGMAQADAQKLLKELGLEADERTRADPAEKGQVIAQDPAGGARLPKGGRVTLLISTGPENLRQVELEKLKRNFLADPRAEELGIDPDRLDRILAGDGPDGLGGAQELAGMETAELRDRLTLGSLARADRFRAILRKALKALDS